MTALHLRRICRATEAYGTPKFAEMRDKCIGQELSWERPAVKWEAVLEELFFGATAPAPSAPRPSPAETKASVATPVQVCVVQSLTGPEHIEDHISACMCICIHAIESSLCWKPLVL